MILQVNQKNIYIGYIKIFLKKNIFFKVGRTARIGCKGNALLFLMPLEEEYILLMNSYNVKNVIIKNFLIIL